MIVVVNKHHFKLDEINIQNAVLDTLKKHKFTKDFDVEVAVVNGEEMEELNKKYYKDEVYEHPVFTFPNTLVDDDFILPPDTKVQLGQIVLNYDFTKDKKEIYDLIAHSTLHLLGVHH